MTRAVVIPRYCIALLDSQLQTLDVRAEHAASGYTCADNSIQQQLQQTVNSIVRYQPMQLWRVCGYASKYVCKHTKIIFQGVASEWITPRWGLATAAAECLRPDVSQESVAQCLFMPWLSNPGLESCKSTTDQVHLDLTTDTVSGTKVDVISLTWTNARYWRDCWCI